MTAPKLPPFAPVGALLISGLGLIGGSVALAARRVGFADRIIAVGRNEERLRAAKDAGVIDEWSTDEATALPQAHWIVLCKPVELIVDEVEHVLSVARPGAIVTDAGSTKESIVSRAETHHHHHDAQFVGSHPMAGSDKSGWENARADLFDGATSFVTLTKKTHRRAAVRTGLFWEALGSRVVYASPQRHDQIVALISHVPHLVAVALIDQLHRSGEDPNLLRLLAGTGLRDTTRIAQGNPEMWEQICTQNALSIAEMLDRVGGRLHDLARLLREHDTIGLRNCLHRTRDLRKQIGDTPPKG
ncbi:prephenate dehydrogenase/arogenate dehydrogenase family protein [bacterium]|nr:prephenate dehydrogenase/arogenate dehydrogenase family protein [bacterium]